MLFLVPTPIGNLNDMTYRAVEVLSHVSVILCEDTRTSGRLLQHFNIENKTLQAFHAHNEHEVLDSIIERLNRGSDIALICDAGTPGISDPGFLLTRACRESGIGMTCLPGSTSIIPAIVMSGLPSDSFFYAGFLPHKKGRNTRLNYLAELDQTIVLLESPHRVGKTLAQLATICGNNRRASLVKEISKIHENVSHGTLEQLVQQYPQTTKHRGEYVIVIEGMTH